MAPKKVMKSETVEQVVSAPAPAAKRRLDLRRLTKSQLLLLLLLLLLLKRRLGSKKTDEKPVAPETSATEEDVEKEGDVRLTRIASC